MHQETLRFHPATLAWLSSGTKPRVPRSIETLKPENRHSAVYRLTGAGMLGENVIAKWCTHETAALESRVYHVLEKLPLSTPRFFACLGRPDGSWMFLEDAGENRYDENDPSHRILAARWLARLHSETSVISKDLSLPTKGPGFYRSLLESAAMMLEQSLSLPLGEYNRDIVRSLIRQLNEIGSLWSEVEEVLAEMPGTLVHSDFSPKNIRIRNGDAHPALLTFDWEHAGFGPPAPDLESVDLRAYRESLPESWPPPDDHTLFRIGQVGRICRIIQGVSWACCELYPEAAETVVSRHMGVYDTSLHETRTALDWVGPA